MEIPPHLHERYGIRKKRFPIGFVAGFLLIISLVAYAFFIRDQVTIRLISWQANATDVTLNWRYEGEITDTVWCLIEVQDEDRFDIGFAFVELSQTDANLTLQHTVTTTKRAFAALTPLCEKDITRLPGSFFKPGVIPPAQLPPLFAPWQLP
jgi:hypothetical protein